MRAVPDALKRRPLYPMEVGTCAWAVDVVATRAIARVENTIEIMTIECSMSLAVRILLSRLEKHLIYEMGQKLFSDSGDETTRFLKCRNARQSYASSRRHQITELIPESMDAMI